MQNESRRPTFDQMLIHSGMGAILGSLLGLGLILTDQNIFRFVATSPTPLLDTAMFVGLFSFLFGMGASMSGFIFSVIELNSLEAKKQAKRINQWRGPDNLK